ncbi:MAG: hypothetical protein ABSD56_04015 [Bryobacteraceae bacterium]
MIGAEGSSAGLLARAGWRPFRLALVTACALRLLYSGAAALLVPVLDLNPARISSNRLTSGLLQRSDGLVYALWGVWQRFDTLFYVHIAQYGYDRPEAVVFYPLYPLLLRAAAPLTGSALAAAPLVSTVAVFFLLWGVHRLLALDLDRGAAARATMFYAIWPVAFMFFAGYAEGLVAALIVWTLYFARTGRWWAAGLCGFAAPLAKAIGALVILPLAVLVWKDRTRRTLPALLCLAGPLAFPAWLAATGRPLPTDVYASYWHVRFDWPWATLAHGFQLASQNPFIACHLLLLAFAAVTAFVKPLRAEYVVYTAAVLLFLLTKSGPLSPPEPLGRYALVLFTAPAGLAQLVRDRAPAAITSAIFMAINFAVLFGFLSWALVV